MESYPIPGVFFAKMFDVGAMGATVTALGQGGSIVALADGRCILHGCLLIVRAADEGRLKPLGAEL